MAIFTAAIPGLPVDFLLGVVFGMAFGVLRWRDAILLSRAAEAGVCGVVDL